MNKIKTDNPPNCPDEANSSASQNCLSELFSNSHNRLERMIEFRLDPRLRNRIDPSDILQDAFLEAQRRVKDLADFSPLTHYVWIRQITLQVLIDAHRAHFRQKRNIAQEIRLDQGSSRNGTSLLMAHKIVGQISTPSRLVSKEEELERLRSALDSMEKVDQEVLALRHFEQLSNLEVAEILGISVTAASNRYVRAMSRLAQIIKLLNAPGDADGR